MDTPRTCACGEPIAAGSSLDVCKRCYHRAYQREYRRQHYHDVVKRSREKLEKHRQHAREGMRRYFADPDKRAAYNAKRRKGASQPGGQ